VLKLAAVLTGSVCLRLLTVWVSRALCELICMAQCYDLDCLLCMCVQAAVLHLFVEAHEQVASCQADDAAAC
jgi:hypothetical protein